jgi:hypothetical protein
MRLVATQKAHQNAAVVDPWTAVHLSTGLAMGLLDLPFRQCMVAAFAYEILEQVVERQEWGKEAFRTTRPETVLNASVDLAVFAVGHWLGAEWNGKRDPGRR